MVVETLVKVAEGKIDVTVREDNTFVTKDVIRSFKMENPWAKSR